MNTQTPQEQNALACDGVGGFDDALAAFDLSGIHEELIALGYSRKGYTLEPDLLLRRIAQGDDSGRMLADAFLSAYRSGKPFNHGLAELFRFDSEAFSLFQSVVHILRAPSLSDDGLYIVQQRIKAIRVALRNQPHNIKTDSVKHQNSATNAPHSEPHPPLSDESRRLLTLLGKRFQSVAGSFDMLKAFDAPSLKSAACIVEDAQALLDAAKSLYADMERPVMSQQHTENACPRPILEVDLLLKRIDDGGHSGQFLADAFISAYRPNRPFQHSLGELPMLDSEALRLFHEILTMRRVSGLTDDGLYELEQRIKTLVGGLQ